MLELGLDRLVGLLPVHAHRAGGSERCEQILRKGFAIAHVRDRADIADRLAEVCEEEGRDEEAKEFRRHSERRDSTIEVSRTVSSAGKVLRQKTQLNFAGAGLPLGELSNVAGMLREMPTVPVTRQKVGRNEPCPCGSGKKFKRCCGACRAGAQAGVHHTDLGRLRAHRSCPGELNLRKAFRHGGKNCGGLHFRSAAGLSNFGETGSLCQCEEVQPARRKIPAFNKEQT